MRLLFRMQAVTKRRQDRDYVERRLGFAVGRFGDCLQRITVHLTDVNGIRGGMDKRCQMLAHVEPGAQICVEQVHADWKVAVDLAAHCLERAVRRELDRLRDRRAAKRGEGRGSEAARDDPRLTSPERS